MPIQSYNYDPLVLRETPHIMVHGKCDAFVSEFVEMGRGEGNHVRVRLVALAKGDCAFINLSS